jgi:hypothetical protein
VRVLDTGLEGIPPVTLSPAGGHEWAIDLAPGINGANYCTTFHPGYSNPVVESDCDCNNNGVRDLCDVENGTSQDVNGNLVPDECETTGAPLATTFSDLILGPAVPNPTKAKTNLVFVLGGDQHVKLTIHDVRGRVVRTLVDEVKPSGMHVTEWNGQDERGDAVAPSIYYAKIISEAGSRTTRIVIVK